MSEELINLIPEMISNTTPFGEVIFSNQRNTTNYAAFRAFDHVADGSVDGWMPHNGGVIEGQYIGYKFEQPTVVNKYSIHDGTYSTDEALKKWEFQGSNDNSHWEVLHLVENEPAWKTGEKRYYELDNVKSFLYYRIFIYENQGANRVRIQEIEMFRIKKTKHFLKIGELFVNINSDSFTLTTEESPTDFPVNIHDVYNLQNESIYQYCINKKQTLQLISCAEDINVNSAQVQTTHELNLLQDDLLQADEVKILNMHEKAEDFNVGVTFIPDHALLLASGDIKLKSIGNIDYFKVDATAIGDAEVKMIASVDEGETWNAYNGDWYEVEPDADVVLEKGTPTEVFNNIPPTAWNELRKFSDTIRFGYLINGRATVHALHSQFDMSGTWKSAYHGEHYDYEYTDNSTMHITLKVDGDYKINY